MLKLQYFGHLMRRTDLLEKTLMLEMIEGRRRRGQQRIRWLDGITDSKQALGVGDGQGSLACCSSGVIRVTNDWTTDLNWGPDRKELAGCHTQSHVSELKLSLMLIAHSNEQAVYHSTLWWIFTDMAITTTLTWDTSETPHKEWWMITSMLYFIPLHGWWASF